MQYVRRHFVYGSFWSTEPLYLDHTWTFARIFESF